MEYDRTDKHESFAMLGIARTTCSGGLNLFGSSIRHYNTIRLRIAPAEVDRHLNRDWFHSTRVPYIEVEMSYSQFAEAITSLNQGDGVPVTLRYLDGKQIEDCPFVDKRQEFENEFEDKMKDITKKLEKLTERTEELLNDKKALTKSEKEEIIKSIKSLRQEVRSNIPFIQQSFNEQIDKTVLEAKGEVEGFVLNKIISTGIEGLKTDMKMIE